MKNQHLLLPILGCALLAMPKPVAAHAQPDSTIVPAVVRGLRPNHEASSSVPVQTIDMEAMQRRGVVSLSDALRRFAGTNVRDYGGAGGLKTVSVRGFGAAHTTLSYDGLPLVDSRTGQADLGRFSLTSLSSVSLHTAGASPLLLPVRSLAATLVEMVTTCDTLRPQTFCVQTGSFGLIGTAGSLNAPVGRAVIDAAVDYRHAANDYPFRVENGALSHDERRSHSQSNDLTARVGAYWHFGKSSSFRATARYNTTHRYLPGPVLLFTSDEHEHLAQQTAFVQGIYRSGADKTTWQSFVGAKFTFDEQRYRDINVGYAGGEMRQNYWQREGYATGGVAYRGGFWGVALSADYGYATMNGGTPTLTAVSRHSLLSALSLRYLPPRLCVTLRLVASGYLNRCPGEAADDFFRVMPEASASYRLYEGRRMRLFLRGHFKMSSRPPTFTENYFYHYGSPRLRPETVGQAGGGVTLEAAVGGGGHFLLTADAYAGAVHDKISAIPATLYVWRCRNVSRVKTAGFDLVAEAALPLGSRHSLVPVASYTLTRQCERGGLQLAYTPRHAAAASVCWENPWLNFGVRTVVASERWTTDTHTAGTRLPPYADCGLFCYRTFPLRSRGGASVSLRLDADNLFGANYELVGRYPMPGRSFRLSLALNY